MSGGVFTGQSVAAKEQCWLSGHALWAALDAAARGRPVAAVKTLVRHTHEAPDFDARASHLRWCREVGGKVEKRQDPASEPQLAPAGRRVPEDDAMERDSRSGGDGKGSLEELLRERIRGTIRETLQAFRNGAEGSWETDAL